MDRKRDILIETSGLSVHFPLKREWPFAPRRCLEAVTDASVRILRGEMFGLVGESGCGKSTLANATLGLERPTAGRVIFDGSDLSRLSAAEMRAQRGRMQKIFQDPASSLNPRFNVFELVAEPMVIREGETKQRQRERVAEMLRAVGLGEGDMDRYPSDFSGGQQQRIAIARSLILEPEYLVCDEPVSALDVSVHAQILNLLLQMQRQRGITCLFISHNLAVVKRICDRLAIMYLGKVVEYGSAERIFARPMHPYTRALISAVLDVDVDGQKATVVLKGDVSSPIDPPPGCRFCKRCPEAVPACEVEQTPLVEIEVDHFVACRFVGGSG